jgi:uncharacterized protein
MSMAKKSEVTTIVARRIKPGYEAQYVDWLHRVSATIAKHPGFHGITIIASTEEPNLWYLVYRFADKKHLDAWQKSVVRQKFLKEIEPYATQHYERATGLETWFALHEHPAAPPKWKMALTVFSGAFLIGVLSHVLLDRYTAGLPLTLEVALYSVITVVLLTWLYMPRISHLLREWLYKN